MILELRHQMSLKYETIIFDKDGTLLDSVQGVVNAVHYALNRLGLAFPAAMDGRRLVGPPLRHTYHNVLGVGLDRLDEAVALHREYYLRQGLYEAVPYVGAKKLLADLNAAGAKVCIATTKYQPLAERMLAHFELTPYIFHAEMSDGTEMSSAKSGMLARTLAASGSAPEHAVMIGDTRFDAEAARDTGVAFIGVLFGYGAREEMAAAGGTRFVGSLEELRAELFV